MGINPNYFQFYSPECEDPIHSPFDRPTFAGVLTGYDLTTVNEEFWEIYIRRHGNNYNKVKLACVFEKDGVPKAPIAGIASKMYQIEVAEEIKPIQSIIVLEKGDMITDTQSLLDAVISAGGNVNSISLRIPSSRIDCSSVSLIDFSLFYKLSDLVFLGSDLPCINNMQFNEGVNLAFINPDNNDSGRRLQSTTSVQKIEIIDKNIGSIMIGNYLFNNKIYELLIKGIFVEFDWSTRLQSVEVH